MLFFSKCEERKTKDGRKNGGCKTRPNGRKRRTGRDDGTDATGRDETDRTGRDDGTDGETGATGTKATRKTGGKGRPRTQENKGAQSERDNDTPTKK